MGESAGGKKGQGGEVASRTDCQQQPPPHSLPIQRPLDTAKASATSAPPPALALYTSGR